MSATPIEPPPLRTSQPKLGEELPVFCEKCGYSLHGLPQVRCERCEILHFHCPECGHHQPINTLRPAAQRIIGRLRAVWLVWVLLFKLNYFGWMLFAWVAMGAEWSYAYNYGRRSGMSYALRPVDLEAMLAFLLFALPFGMVSRMLLLRWHRGVIVGFVLGALVVGGTALGIWIQSIDRNMTFAWSEDWTLLLAWTFCFVAIGATVVWPIWVGFAKALLPSSLSKPLLEWQRSQSDRSYVRLAHH